MSQPVDQLPSPHHSLPASAAAELRSDIRSELGAALAIAKHAESAGRGLSGTEQQQIEVHRANAAALRSTLANGHQGAPGYMSGRASGDRRDQFRDVETGETIQSFGARDSISAYLAERGAFTPEASFDAPGGGASLGKIIVAGITGKNLSGLSRAEASSMSSGSVTSGGLLADAEVFGSVIDAARPLMATMRAGARTVVMDRGTIKLVRVDSPVVPGWVAEDEEQVESAPTFSALVLTALNLAVEVRISEELLMDAPDAATVVEQQLVKGFALELDRVGLVGRGLVSEPRGIANHPNVLTDALGANGAVPTSYDFLLDALFAVRAENYEPTAGIYSVRTAKTLAKLKRTVETLDQLPAPAEVAALPRFATTQVGNDFTQGSSTASSIAIVGDYAQLLFGLRSELRIEASKHAYNTTSGSAFSKRQVAIRGWLRGDVGLVRAAAFHVTTGINAS